jgi:hypothetical protein
VPQPGDSEPQAANSNCIWKSVGVRDQPVLFCLFLVVGVCTASCAATPSQTHSAGPVDMTVRGRQYQSSADMWDCQRSTCGAVRIECYLNYGRIPCTDVVSTGNDFSESGDRWNDWPPSCNPEERLRAGWRECDRSGEPIVIAIRTVFANSTDSWSVVGACCSGLSALRRGTYAIFGARGDLCNCDLPQVSEWETATGDDGWFRYRQDLPDPRVKRGGVCWPYRVEPERGWTYGVNRCIE